MKTPRSLALVFVLFLSLAMLASPNPAAADDKTAKHPERKIVTGVKSGDEEMLAAKEKARSTLKTYVEALQSPEEGARYLLKVKLQEGDDIEHVRLEPVKWKDPNLVGVLAVDPVTIEEHKRGDVIAPLPRDVSDWLILSEDGSKEGGFTVDVLQKRREAAGKSESDKKSNR